MGEFLFCLAIPVCQLLGLVAIGLLFRVDRPGAKHYTDATPDRHL